MILDNTIPLAIKFIALFGIIYSIASFYIGYHNIDLAHIYTYFNNRFSSYVNDKGNDNIIRTPNEMYSLGLNQIERGFLIFGLSALIFGLSEKSYRRENRKTHGY